MELKPIVSSTGRVIMAKPGYKALTRAELTNTIKTAWDKKLASVGYKPEPVKPIVNPVVVTEE
jgi:hypothetical protein